MAPVASTSPSAQASAPRKVPSSTGQASKAAWTASRCRMASPASARAEAAVTRWEARTWPGDAASATSRKASARADGSLPRRSPSARAPSASEGSARQSARSSRATSRSAAGEPRAALGGALEQVALPAGVVRLVPGRRRGQGEQAGPAPAGADLLRSGDQPVEGAAAIGVDAEAPLQGLGVVGALLEEPVERLDGQGPIPGLLGQLGERGEPVGERRRVEGVGGLGEQDLVQVERLLHRPSGVEQARQQLAREGHVPGPLRGRSGRPAAPRPGRPAPGRAAPRRGTPAPTRARRRRGRRRSRAARPRGGGRPGAGAARRRAACSSARARSAGSLAIASRKPASASTRRPAAASRRARSRRRSSGGGRLEDGEPVEQVDDGGVVAGAQGAGEAGLGGARVARGERARLLGVDPRRGGVAGGEVERGEAQEQRGALAGGGGRHEPGEPLPLRRVVAAGARRGDERPPGLAGVVPAQAGLERAAERRVALRREAGGDGRVAGQREPQRQVGLPAEGGLPGRGEHGAGVVGRADPGGARSALVTPGGMDEPRHVGEGPARGAERRGQDLVERGRGGRGAARGDHQAPQRAGHGAERRRSGAGVEGGGEPRELQLQVDQGEPGADRPGPQPHGCAPPLEPELEPGRGGGCLLLAGPRTRVAILPWIGLLRGNRLLLLGDLGRPGAMHDE